MDGVMLGCSPRPTENSYSEMRSSHHEPHVHMRSWQRATKYVKQADPRRDICDVFHVARIYGVAASRGGIKALQTLNMNHQARPTEYAIRLSTRHAKLEVIFAKGPPTGLRWIHCGF